MLWRSERTRRREQERADAHYISELRWQWRNTCSGTPLAHMIYTPSGATRAVPMIEHVDLGPPVTFIVRMRPGQTTADFVAAAPSIAPAFSVSALEVTPLAQPWVRIVLVPDGRSDLDRRQPELTGAPTTVAP